MAERISELLGSEEGLNKIKETAAALLSGDGNGKDTAQSTLGDIESLIPDGVDVGRLLGVLSSLKSSGNDDRTALIYALMPHLSGERRHRAEKAVKLMKIISVLPAIKQAGLLDIL